MKLTSKQLKRMIKEELKALMEAGPKVPFSHGKSYSSQNIHTRGERDAAKQKKAMYAKADAARAKYGEKPEKPQAQQDLDSALEALDDAMYALYDGLAKAGAPVEDDPDDGGLGSYDVPGGLMANEDGAMKMKKFIEQGAGKNIPREAQQQLQPLYKQMVKAAMAVRNARNPG